jgi:radical SAM protein with 4Fe4S-binding SPASM domain
MPNILLTTRCNLSCKYCFAQEKLTGKRMHMPMENVREVIEFLKRSEYPVFRVMGGEPTLHPNFTEIIHMALSEWMRVDVLSNATWSESCSDLFSRIAPTRLLFLLNIDHPDNYADGIWEQIQSNLEKLKGRQGVTLSFNVFEKQPRSDYIFEIARRYEFNNIRLSLSLPVYKAENAFLPLEELHEVAPFVMEFAEKAESAGINVQFDNAVPLCIFTEEQAGKLLLHGVLDLKRNMRCEPIIDISPDLTIFSCFCLSQLANRNLNEFKTLQEAKKFFLHVWSVYQDAVYPMEKCLDCFYREKWGCQGGCLTYSISKDQGQRYEQLKTAGDNTVFNPGYALALADDVILMRYDVPCETYLLRNTATGVEFELNHSLQPILPLLDGTRNNDELVQSLVGRGNGSSTLQNFMQNEAAESLSSVFSGLIQQGFLKHVAGHRNDRDAG